jgi:hypothetical protein
VVRSGDAVGVAILGVLFFLSKRLWWFVVCLFVSCGDMVLFGIVESSSGGVVCGVATKGLDVVLDVVSSLLSVSSPRRLFHEYLLHASMLKLRSKSSSRLGVLTTMSHWIQSNGAPADARSRGVADATRSSCRLFPESYPCYDCDCLSI